MKVALFLLLLGFFTTLSVTLDSSQELNSGEDLCYWSDCFMSFAGFEGNRCKEGFKSERSTSCWEYAFSYVKQYCCPK
uniref:BPTI/Kunitz inhibitor domain-containing protein n=1 Tax=Steinernema glaseri TaxID=37863 RepID=A0A1I7Y1J7_9BILA